MALRFSGARARGSRALSLSSLTLLAGCGSERTVGSELESEPRQAAGRDASYGGGRADAEPGNGSAFCDVMKVVRESCLSCHGEPLKAGAPMPLSSYDDFLAASPLRPDKRVYELVQSRVHDAKRPMPPGRPLSPASLAAIDRWVQAGVEPGPDEHCEGGAVEQAESPPWPPEGCTETYRIVVSGSEATVAAGAESHPQFILDAPWGDADVQALGFRPITDNARVLHHWILYENRGLGAFLTGWAPGNDGSGHTKLPAEVGHYLPKGKRSLRLDMHYNNLAGAESERDASGVEVCVTRALRPHSATTFMGFNALPIIPPGQELDAVGTCIVATDGPVLLLSESPHAHTLATHTKLILKRGDQETVLHDAPFAFDGQVVTPFPAPVELRSGDRVVTTCHYENDTNKTVRLGEDTGNEMCFNFVRYYPMGALRCSFGSTGIPGFGSGVGGLTGLSGLGGR